MMRNLCRISFSIFASVGLSIYELALEPTLVVAAEDLPTATTTSRQSLLRGRTRITSDAYLSTNKARMNIENEEEEEIILREYFLEAKETQIAFGNGDGMLQTMATYNGMIPGPTLEGNVGDTMRVHFTNTLTWETSIHWHGVEVPANMDGSTLSQRLVAPGETFVYEFKLLKASTYWYHPDVKANEEIELGLYGPMIVHDPIIDEHYTSNQYTLVLDDVLLDEDGIIAQFFDEDQDPVNKAEQLLNGRVGNQFLVNGNYVPLTSLPYTTESNDSTAQVPTLKEGDEIRLRIINAANSRVMRLSFPNQDVYKISSDGGLIDKPYLLSPIDLIPTESGVDITITTHDQNEGMESAEGSKGDDSVSTIVNDEVNSSSTWYVGDGPQYNNFNDGSRLLGFQDIHEAAAGTTTTNDNSMISNEEVISHVELKRHDNNERGDEDNEDEPRDDDEDNEDEPRDDDEDDKDEPRDDYEDDEDAPRNDGDKDDEDDIKASNHLDVETPDEHMDKDETDTPPGGDEDDNEASNHLEVETHDGHMGEDEKDTPPGGDEDDNEASNHLEVETHDGHMGEDEKDTPPGGDEDDNMESTHDNARVETGLVVDRFISNPDPNKGLLLTPGERAEVVFVVKGPGPLTIEWHDFPVGSHQFELVDEDNTLKVVHGDPMDGKRPPQVLVEWPVQETEDNMNIKSGIFQPPQYLATIDRIIPSDLEPIEFHFGHQDPTPDGDIRFFSQVREDVMLSYNDIGPYEAPTVEAYSQRYIDVTNHDMHDHNFHLHGFHFQHVYTQYVAENGVTAQIEVNPHLEWRDTIRVPRRLDHQGGFTILRLAVQFGNPLEDRQVCASGKELSTTMESGGWMVECHLHDKSGMASFLQVVGCDDKTQSEP